MGLIHWYVLPHIAVSPLYIICKATLSSGFCTSESLHNEGGLHKYIVVLKYLCSLANWEQTFVLLAVLTVGIFF